MSPANKEGVKIELRIPDCLRHDSQTSALTALFSLKGLKQEDCGKSEKHEECFHEPVNRHCSVPRAAMQARALLTPVTGSKWRRGQHRFSQWWTPFGSRQTFLPLDTKWRENAEQISSTYRHFIFPGENGNDV